MQSDLGFSLCFYFFGAVAIGVNVVDSIRVIHILWVFEVIEINEYA